MGFRMAPALVLILRLLRQSGAPALEETALALQLHDASEAAARGVDPGAYETWLAIHGATPGK